MPYAQHFQEAGAEGFRMVSESALRGDQWIYRRLQRDPYLHGLWVRLPKEMGSFIRRDELYIQNRLVYFSESLGVELVFRRRRSLRVVGSKKAIEEPGLFPKSMCKHRADDAVPHLAACIWDLPRFDSKHRPMGLFPFVVKLAKPGTTLEQGEWEDSFRLHEESEVIPKSAEYDMDDLDWEVDSAEVEGL